MVSNTEDLQAFVTAALKAVASGVTGVQIPGVTCKTPEKVDFELAVSLKETSELGGGLKVYVVGAQAKKQTETEQVTRICFSVLMDVHGKSQPLDLSRLKRGVV